MLLIVRSVSACLAACHCMCTQAPVVSMNLAVKSTFMMAMMEDLLWIFNIWDTEVSSTYHLIERTKILLLGRWWLSAWTWWWWLLGKYFLLFLFFLRMVVVVCMRIPVHKWWLYRHWGMVIFPLSGWSFDIHWKILWPFGSWAPIAHNLKY